MVGMVEMVESGHTRFGAEAIGLKKFAKMFEKFVGEVCVK